MRPTSTEIDATLLEQVPTRLSIMEDNIMAWFLSIGIHPRSMEIMASIDLPENFSTRFPCIEWKPVELSKFNQKTAIDASMNRRLPRRPSRRHPF